LEERVLKSSGIGREQVVSSSGHSNKNTSGFVICWEFLEPLQL